MKTCFKLKEVRKTYGASVGKKVVRPALNVAELEFYEGQTTAIIGYSGSGKSSLLNLLSLLDVPDQGQGDIFYQGQSYRAISTNEGAKNRLRRDAFPGGDAHRGRHSLSGKQEAKTGRSSCDHGIRS